MFWGKGCRLDVAFHGRRARLDFAFGEPCVVQAEDGTLVQAILEEAPETGIVRVVIGQENRGDFMWPLSVVIGRYGIPDEVVGIVGAVGPMRMEYSRAIAGVELLGMVMSEIVEDVHGA